MRSRRTISTTGEEEPKNHMKDKEDVLASNKTNATKRELGVFHGEDR